MKIDHDELIELAKRVKSDLEPLEWYSVKEFRDCRFSPDESAFLSACSPKLILALLAPGDK